MIYDLNYKMPTETTKKHQNLDQSDWIFGILAVDFVSFAFSLLCFANSKALIPEVETTSVVTSCLFACLPDVAA